MSRRRRSRQRPRRSRRRPRARPPAREHAGARRADGSTSDAEAGGIRRVERRGHRRRAAGSHLRRGAGRRAPRGARASRRRRLSGAPGPTAGCQLVGSRAWGARPRENVSSSASHVTRRRWRRLSAMNPWPLRASSHRTPVALGRARHRLDGEAFVRGECVRALHPAEGNVGVASRHAGPRRRGRPVRSGIATVVERGAVLGELPSRSHVHVGREWTAQPHWSSPLTSMIWQLTSPCVTSP